MRKAILVLSLALPFVLAAARPAAAQNWANKAFPNGNPSSPVLVPFGTVARGAQLEKKIPMTNIWKVPLEVTDIKVSCGCVEALVENKKLQPNESTTLTIKMDGTRFNGEKSVNVYVTFGPQFVSTANLIVTAHARQDVVLNPGDIDFGIVQRGGAPATRSLDVEYAGKLPWKITQAPIKSDKAPFDLTLQPLPPRAAKDVPIIGYRVTATLKPDAVVGPFRETVDLVTNDPQQPKVSFLVIGNVSNPVQVAPNPIQVTNLKLGNTTKTQVVVTANQPFRITGVLGNGNDVNLVLPAGGPASPVHVLDVQVSPKTPGLLNRELILQTDMRNETVKVIIKGNVN